MGGESAWIDVRGDTVGMMETGQTVTNTVSGTQNSKETVRENNLTIIRVAAAIFVFTGHMAVIRDGELSLFAGFLLHELGVRILFLLSGYLITMSWISDPHPLRYAVRRFFRLWPPFAVMVLLMTFIAGPLLSDMGPGGYFQSWYTVFLQNLRFYVVYAMPGVFVDMPVAYTINGSLWTMPVEAALYVLTPILVTLLPRKRHPKASLYITAVLTVSVCVFDLYLRKCYTGAGVVIYGTELVSAFHLIVLYMLGMLYTYEEMRKYLNLQAGCVSILLLFVVQHCEPWIQYLALYVILPYAIFSFAFAPKPAFKNFGKRLEPSYGIYLYGFFFQQVLVFLERKNGISFTYMEEILISAAPTMAAAALSYYLVEKPCLRLSKYLIAKLKAK